MYDELKFDSAGALGTPAQITFTLANFHAQVLLEDWFAGTHIYFARHFGAAPEQFIGRHSCAVMRHVVRLYELLRSHSVSKVSFLFGFVGIMIGFLSLLNSCVTHTNDLFCYQMKYGVSCSIMRIWCNESQSREPSQDITQVCRKEESFPAMPSLPLQR
jgi:hypothetical protein